jgi:hypothetical protein
MSRILLALLFFSAAALADPIPPGWQASGLKPIGYTDLNGRRGGIKLAIKKVGERWVLYKGGSGIEVVDVTNPEDPRLVKVVPGVKEVGWFIPPDPPKPVISQGGALTGAATQEVLQDTRGVLYVLDSGWGIWVLRDESKGNMR